MINYFSKIYKNDLEKLLTQNKSKGYRVFKLINKLPKGKYNIVYLPNTLHHTTDIQHLASRLRKVTGSETSIIIVSFNFLWKPILSLATKLRLRQKDIQEPNWLTKEDIKNIFEIEGFREIKHSKRFLFPFEIPFITNLINKYLANLPLINLVCLTSYQIFRIPKNPKKYSVSIIIPARNEEGNIKGVLKKIPNIGKKTEIIFVENNSTDNTIQEINNEIKNNGKNMKVILISKKTKGKAEAVRLGFRKASGDILMILDADLTVSPSELPKFYNVLANGVADFANGSRLIYPMEKQAMRTANYIGNKIVSLLFTFILEQKIKDTLCGTKVLFKKDYKEIEKNRSYFGNFDPWGDFDLLFGISRLNLKIVDIPVRYKERTKGKSNMRLIRHGIALMKMLIIGAKKLKFV